VEGRSVSSSSDDEYENENEEERGREREREREGGREGERGRDEPKNPAHTVSAMIFPISCCGFSDRRSREYIAGMAETNSIPRPPAATVDNCKRREREGRDGGGVEPVAALWTVQFSWGHTYVISG
jgi:hypothetical protein